MPGGQREHGSVSVLGVPDADLHVGDDLDAANLLDRFDRVRLSTKHEPSDLNRLRGDIYDEAVTTAVTRPKGDVPAHHAHGYWQVLTSTGFALHHALHYGHCRVIMAVPFITITRQTARILRTYLGENSVLEQHSGVDLPEDSWMKLATENWDAPFVITTTVIGASAVDQSL